MFDFIDSYPWLLPIIIFFGRICDVTLGTLRIIFVSKGEKMKAPIVGFFEVFIWIVVISQIFSHATHIISYLAYALGYASGNFVGIMIENKIGYGYQLFRIYTKKNGAELTKILNQMGFGSTLIRGEGAISEIDIIESVVRRKAEKRMSEIITSFDPDAFYVIEDIRSKQKGIFAYSTAAGLPRLGK
ncbi:MAG: DUF5698 domain-containing protein [Tannerella sp.]|jgi:uncharacterized protein YebE (UPF0316 family)|nr:DUF5698 domain-containing protein [Tannerella sp.]